MGMFDYISVSGQSITNVPPIVAEILEEDVFQTKSLYRYLERYEIRDDGCLYRREKDDDGVFWVKIIKTINIEFHTDVDGYWISFTAEYKRGELVIIKLNEYRIIGGAAI